VEVVQPPDHNSVWAFQGSGKLPTWDPDEALLNASCSHPGVKAIGPNNCGEREAWRKQKLREVLADDIAESSLPDQEREQLWSLLEEYQDVFSLEEGEERQTLRSYMLTQVEHYPRSNQPVVSHLLCGRR